LFAAFAAWLLPPFFLSLFRLHAMPNDAPANALPHTESLSALSDFLRAFGPMSLADFCAPLARDAEKLTGHAPVRFPNESAEWRGLRDRIERSAACATAEDMARMRYFERAESFSSWKNIAPHFAIVAALVESGAIWGDASNDEARNPAIFEAFLKEPARLGPLLAQRPEWAAISVECDPHARLHEAMRRGPDGREISAAIALADSLGRLAQLAARPDDLGEKWFFRCVAAGDADGAEKCAAAGLRLDGLTQERVQSLLLAVLRQSGFSSGLRAVAQRQANLWSLAVKAGLPKLEWSETPTATELATIHLCSLLAMQGGLAVMAEEAMRGGGLSGAGREIWVHASLARGWTDSELSERVGCPPDKTPFEWAAERGLDPSRVGPAELQRSIPAAASAWRMREGLAGLLRAGVKLGPDNRAVGHGDGVAHAALRSKANAPELALLAQLGVDFARPDNKGRTPLQLLMESESATASITVQAFLQAIEAGRPGADRQALDAPGKNGSRPIHWAAKSLNVQMLELALARGGSLLDIDAQGNTAAHWAAAKHSSSKDEKSKAVIAWLDRNGVDWMAANRKGDTAVAVFARRGTSKRAMDIIQRIPSAATAANAKGVSALDELGARRPAWRAEAESIVLQGEIAALKKDASAQSVSTSAEPIPAANGTPLPPGRRARRM